MVKNMENEIKKKQIGTRLPMDVVEEMGNTKSITGISFEKQIEQAMRKFLKMKTPTIKGENNE